MQQHNKLVSNGPVHKQLVRICLGDNGPFTKATCNWFTGRGGGGVGGGGGGGGDLSFESGVLTAQTRDFRHG